MFDDPEFKEILDDTTKWELRLRQFIEPEEDEKGKQFIIEIPEIKDEIRILIESISNMKARRVADLNTLGVYRKQLMGLVNDPVVSEIDEIRDLDRYIESEWNVRVSLIRQVNLLTKALILTLDEFEDYYVALLNSGLKPHRITDANRGQARDRKEILIQERHREETPLEEGQVNQIDKIIKEYIKLKKTDDDKKQIKMNFKKQEIKNIIPNNRIIKKQIGDIFKKFTGDNLW